MSPYKVVWREQSSQFQAARVASDGGKIVIPDHKLMAVSCSSLLEADYLTALLSSSICKLLVVSYVLSTSTSTHVLDHIAIPRYEPKDSMHKTLSTLSNRCHEAVAQGETEAVASIELEIDRLAAQIWGVTKQELDLIQRALEALDQPRQQRDTIDREE